MLVLQKDYELLISSSCKKGGVGIPTVPLDMVFTMQYMHHFKKEVDTLRISVEKRRFKTRVMKSIASAEISLGQVVRSCFLGGIYTYVLCVGGWYGCVCVCICICVCVCMSTNVHIFGFGCVCVGGCFFVD